MPPLLLRLLLTSLLLGKEASSCDEVAECQTISVQASTSQINVTGLAGGFTLQNVTTVTGTLVQASDNSANNTSLMSFVSGTQYIIHYGNASLSCCYNVTTTPPEPTQLPLVTASPASYNSITFTFPGFNSTYGPIRAYAVIVSNTNVEGLTPPASALSVTYADYKNKNTTSYVAKIISGSSIGKGQRSTQANSIPVTVGNGTTTGSYLNGALEPLSSYWFSIVGFTEIAYDGDGRIAAERSKYIPTYFTGPYSTPQNQGTSTSQNPRVIIGAVVGSILSVLAIALIGFVIFWRRRRGGRMQESSSPTQSVRAAPHAMSSASFLTHFQEQSADSNLGFIEEYEKLGHCSVKPFKSAFENAENKDENNFSNVPPYDASRVILSKTRSPADDYINANVIRAYSHAQELIAAQGPLPKTINDFWRMIWEKDVRAVVMLTKCVELGKVKCEEYWPQRVRIYGNLQVKITNETALPDWTTRDFTVTDMESGKKIKVRHFHFTTWPDHDVPKTTNDLIQFRNLIRAYAANHCPPNSPILVHCSARLGRTGTFIALDHIIKQIEVEDRIDVFAIVRDLQMHHGLMVQTDSQYVFLNKCALDYINGQTLYQDVCTYYENSTVASQP